jgi:tRNA(Ile)-lysidine synthase
MHVLDPVRQTIRQHDLARAGTRVVAAVSGGSDSVALAHILRELAAAGELCLAGLAHFNHQLRATAADDERCAAAVAAAVGVEMFVEREDVAARARREHRSTEDAARTARHAFFERARLHFNADVVALGHTRDDQAETVLLRLVRGAGPRGLAAMYPRKGCIIRPLLGARRQDLREWLDARGVTFVEDETNADVAIPRNRVRAELLPLLAARFNPSIVDVLADEAEIAREVWEWMTSAAAAYQGSVGSVGSEGSEGSVGSEGSPTNPSNPPNPPNLPNPVAELNVEMLRAAPMALRRLIVWKAMQRTARGRPVSFGHVEAALRLMETGGSIDAPAHCVERVGDRLVLTGRAPGTKGRFGVVRNLSNRANRPNLFRYPLSIPGEAALPEAGWIVSAEPAAGADRAIVSSGGFEPSTAIVRGDLCLAPLSVRNRRPGDRFTPIGLRGRKKLQDFFVDRKVARRDRDAVPLVVDAADRIVWVAGYGIDEAFRVTNPAQAVVIFKVRRV